MIKMMQKIKIKNFSIGVNEPIFIIAEVGVNHNGNIDVAKKLIDVAKESGANCVKFQTFVTDEVISKNTPLAEYQKNSTNVSSQYELVKNLELSENDFLELKNYTEKSGLIFLSTPFDLHSVNLLDRINVDAFKISSGEITNKSLIEKISTYKKPIILSTGMSNLDEISEAINWITQNGCTSLAILQCTSNYPTELSNCNLSTISTLSEKYHVPIGFSDHTLDSLASIVAIGLGVKIIEKHITLSKDMSGPDHKASLEPHEFKSFVNQIRLAESILGDGIKKCLPCETNVKLVARKSLVVIDDMKKGEILTIDKIAIKRPGTGIEPKYIEQILNKKLKNEIKKDQILRWNDISGNPD